MREIFGFGFTFGKWNFVLGAEIHLTSWVLGIRYSPPGDLYVQRDLTLSLPTLAFVLTWIDDENMEKKLLAHERLATERRQMHGIAKTIAKALKKKDD